MFSSDNGSSGVADFPFLLTKGYNPSYIFRDKKTSIYEGGHRVTTIVHYQNKIGVGQVCKDNVSHVDFFRTFADMLDISLSDNAGEDSFSNLKTWFNNEKSLRKSTIYSSHSSFLSIVSGKWKLECCENGGTSKAADLAMMKNEFVE